jgi:hypothetical protein
MRPSFFLAEGQRRLLKLALSVEGYKLVGSCDFYVQECYQIYAGLLLSRLGVKRVQKTSCNE